MRFLTEVAVSVAVLGLLYGGTQAGAVLTEASLDLLPWVTLALGLWLIREA